MINEIAVSDELYAVHEEMVMQEKSNHKKNTRRHISLAYLQENSLDVEEIDSDPAVILVKKETGELFKRALSILSVSQRELFEKVYLDGVKIAGIARKESLSHGTVSTKIKRIKEKLKKFFENVS